ncbi:MAG: hypothetical protein U0836_04375 [Pirellulales bacterium]
MAKVMVNLSGLSAPPTLAEVQARYGLSADDLDPEFGVIEVDPEEHIYTVLVEEQAAARITGADPATGGPFSNPPIAPFGPPQP